MNTQISLLLEEMISLSKTPMDIPLQSLTSSQDHLFKLLTLRSNPQRSLRENPFICMLLVSSHNPLMSPTSTFKLYLTKKTSLKMIFPKSQTVTPNLIALITITTSLLSFLLDTGKISFTL